VSGLKTSTNDTSLKGIEVVGVLTKADGSPLSWGELNRLIASQGILYSGLSYDIDVNKIAGVKKNGQ